MQVYKKNICFISKTETLVIVTLKGTRTHGFRHAQCFCFQKTIFSSGYFDREKVLLDNENS